MTTEQHHAAFGITKEVGLGKTLSVAVTQIRRRQSWPGGIVDG